MMKRILAYLLQGILYTAPFTITIYIVVQFYYWIDGALSSIITAFNIKSNFPGYETLTQWAGALIILVLLVIIGRFGSNVLLQPFFVFLDSLVKKAPLIKIIYSAIRDLLSAFVGDKKRFDKPVTVTINKESRISKLGFITREDLSFIGVKDEMVSVYCPHSYAFSGELYIVPAENVTLLDKPASEVMKFVMSGGVIEMHEKAPAQK